MPGLLATLEAIDTSKLTLHVQAANGAVGVSGSASLASLDPRDLLGDYSGPRKLDHRLSYSGGPAKGG